MKPTDAGRWYRALVYAGLILLSLVFMLIVDLDRSQQGFVTIPQKALIDLQRQLQTGAGP